MSIISGRLYLPKCLQLLQKPTFIRCNVASLTRPTSSQSVDTLKESSEELDTLYKYLDLELKAHEQPILYSYKKFVLMASEELGVPFVKSEEPWRCIYRKPLLKSRFIYKDHRAVYEFRTYFLNMKFKNLTGSTADTFLEYIERNLPEGVHMTVIKTALTKFPDHLNPQQALASE